MYYSTITARLNKNYRNKSLEDYYGMNSERDVILNSVRINDYFIISGIGFDLNINFGINNVENYDNVLFYYKGTNELKVKGVIVVKEIYDFIKEMNEKMRIVDNYFKINNEKNVIQLTSSKGKIQFLSNIKIKRY